MQLGMVGLGRMGANMVRRLQRGGHACVVFNLNPENVSRLVSEGATGAHSIEDFVGKLSSPRAAWMMVPAGEATDRTVQELASHMDRPDIIIDGGNSHFKDDVRRARTLREKGIRYVDVGTSGGIWGVERGYCLMIGGDPETVEYLEPLFETLAPGGETSPELPAVRPGTVLRKRGISAAADPARDISSR